MRTFGTLLAIMKRIWSDCPMRDCTEPNELAKHIMDGLEESGVILTGPVVMQCIRHAHNLLERIGIKK